VSVRAASALALGAAAYAASWAFGSRALAVVGLGLGLAGLASLAWRRLARGPVTATLRVAPAPATEGDTLRLGAEVRRPRRLPTGGASLELAWPRLGEARIELRGAGCHAHGATVLANVPRGIHRPDRSAVVQDDPLGLERVERPVDGLPALIVRPRVVQLDSLFAGGLLERAPASIRRPRFGATDIRSVRPYREGEPLRAVHWPTTARRGALTVKELEGPEGRDLVLLLDCGPTTDAGRPPDTPFETAVRAAGSLAVTLAARGRSALLLTTGRESRTVRVGPRAVNEALNLLAGVQADGPAPLEVVLAHQRELLGASSELVVVTARASAWAAAALRARVTALVWVDAASWTGTGGRTPGVVSLVAAGVPVAVVQRGEDLARALSGGLQAGWTSHG
jgi:uncharacterized protein (DUF58 family)